MNFVFLDFIPWDYDVGTPLARPLGGSQSALCYLAAALARAGHRVTTLTGTSKPRQVNGVQCLNYQDIPAEVFAPADTLTIVLNGPGDVVGQVRTVIGGERPVILWTQHAHDQPAMQSLRDPATAAQWSRIVCISDWQKSMFQQELGVPASKIEVHRNAISPAFENLFAGAEPLAAAKAGPPRLAYTSTPFRGLDVLAACFPVIHRRHASCRLDVFSSMQVYGQPDDQDSYRPLYAQCQSTPGIQYRGSISQTDLAQELAGAHLLAYPNTFPETSCIAVMEALAAGLSVVTSELGALPETCAGFAQLVSPVSATHSAEQFMIDFTRQVDRALSDLQSDPLRWVQQRFEQSRAINATCTWARRAAEWQNAASGWLTNR